MRETGTTSTCKIRHICLQVTSLDSLLVDECEKVHAHNLHGADAAALRATRAQFFPDGELDDGGGAIPPLAAGLLASDGTEGGAEAAARADGVADGAPLAAAMGGVLPFADYLKVRTEPFAPV